MNSLVGSGLSLVLLLLVTGSSVLQEDSREASGLGVRHIEACGIRLKPLSAGADFVGRWTYKATVNAAGSVEAIDRLDDPVKAAPFVELADFESCVRRWRFVKPGSYSIQLHGGTMSDRWSVTVSNGAESMRLVIPRKD